VSRNGNPVGWDENKHRVNPWSGRLEICVGENIQSDQNGLKTSIPEGKDVLWLRVDNN
jgi:hypothetical protein